MIRKAIPILSFLTAFVLYASSTLAQAPEGIKYQAVARDASGSMMSNSSMTVRIGIYKDAGAATKMYEETQNVTTNQFGLFNLVIGEGSAIFGTFANVDWGSSEHHLKVEVNTGSGYVDMGTNQLQSVPYSLFAKEAGSVDNMDIGQLADVDVSGVSNGQILKWDGTEWVVSNDEGLASVNTDATIDGDGSAGNDLKIAQQNATSGQVLKWDGSTWSPATDSSGSSYTAGNGISISGNTITNTDPDQPLSLTGSGAASVSGTYPNFTISSSDSNTTYSPGTGITLNGTSFNAENTTAMWNADQLQGSPVSATAPSTGEILKWDGSQWNPVLNTDTSHWRKTGNHIFTETESVGIGVDEPLTRLQVNGGEDVLFGDTTGGYGSRFMWDASNGALRAGVANENWDSDSIGFRSVAFGFNTKAISSYSAALGFNTTASGSSSLATGNNTTSSGYVSFATGANTTASGSRSMAIGYYTTASGSGALATGYRTTAPSAYETVLGRYNTSYTPDDSIYWDSSDRLFVIGNGFSSASPSDALVVLKNGNVGIGVSTPSEDLEIDGSSIFRMSSTDYLLIDHENYEPSIIPHGNVTSNGKLGTSSYPFYQVYSNNFYASSSGSYLTYSDSRIKENIQPIESAIEKLRAIKGVRYDIKENHHSRNGEPRDKEARYNQIGLLAQDVEKVFPQLVNTNDKTGLKSVGYMGLIPVIVEGVKEQQTAIEQREQENEELKQQVSSLKQRLLQMEKRLNQLEEK